MVEWEVNLLVIFYKNQETILLSSNQNGYQIYQLIIFSYIKIRNVTFLSYVKLTKYTKLHLQRSTPNNDCQQLYKVIRETVSTKLKDFLPNFT